MFRFLAERFVGSGETETLTDRIRNLTPENSFVLLLVFAAVLFINLFVIRYLWNNMLSRTLSLKPIDLWTALGIKVLIMALAS